MANEVDQPVFISWSKEMAKKIALQLDPWLNSIFDNIEPWVSDTAIDPGSRTYTSIADALHSSVFGIIIVTQVNQFEPWLNYEAGALSSRFPEDNQARVVPLLIDFANAADLTSPIKQFQSCLFNAEGIHKLCKALAKVIGAKPESVRTRVDKFWPDLEEQVKRILKEYEAEPPDEWDIPDSEMQMDEIVLGIRELIRRSDASAPQYLRVPRLLAPTGIRTIRELLDYLADGGLVDAVANDGSVLAAVKEELETYGFGHPVVQIITDFDTQVAVNARVDPFQDSGTADRIMTTFNTQDQAILNIYARPAHPRVWPKSSHTYSFAISSLDPDISEPSK